MNINEPFQWEQYPEGEKFIQENLDKELINKDLKTLSCQIEQISCRLFDFLDYLSFPLNEEENVLNAGFKLFYKDRETKVYRNPRAQFPLIILNGRSEVGVAVESIADFLRVRGLEGEIEGTPFSGFRRCLISDGFYVVERRTFHAHEPIYEGEGYLDKYLEAEEKWASRPRNPAGFDEALKRARGMVELVGKPIAASLVCEGERKYWQARNYAGQVQKNRQDAIGLGWANHDHHTFRSSRKNFPKLVQLFEILGFQVRERFYAGKEAGWGAQVMEHPDVRLVLFLDVDLQESEVAIDFAHQPLPETDKLGTIGLWCELHGDSILESGMHHLEAQFQFDELKKDLNARGVQVMEPFSNFEYLKQAFTQGDNWKVEPNRLERLLREGKITSQEKEKFAREGAVGSHLENLQRREGYKGFNQKNVSIIIKKTDPRELLK